MLGSGGAVLGSCGSGGAVLGSEASSALNSAPNASSGASSAEVAAPFQIRASRHCGWQRLARAALSAAAASALAVCAKGLPSMPPEGDLISDERECISEGAIGDWISDERECISEVWVWISEIRSRSVGIMDAAHATSYPASAA